MSARNRGEARPLGTVLRLALVASFWGSSFPVSKVALAYAPPLMLAALRYLVGGILLLALALREGRGRALPRRDLWPALALFSLTSVILFNALFYTGLRLATAVNGSLIQPTTNSLTMALLAHLVLRERLASWRYLAFPLATVGVFLLVTGDPSRAVDPGAMVGNLLYIGAGASFAVSGILGRSLFRRLPPLEALGWSVPLGGGVLLLLSALLEAPPVPMGDAPLAFWGAVLYLGIFTVGLGYLWWFRGVHRLGATRTGVFTFLVPVVGALLSVVFLREPFHPVQGLGALLALAGVALVLL